MNDIPDEQECCLCHKFGAACQCYCKPGEVVGSRNTPAESALLTEVAAWLEREGAKAEDLAGKCAEAKMPRTAEIMLLAGVIVRGYVASLRDGSWRSHPSRGAGEAGK